MESGSILYKIELGNTGRINSEARRWQIMEPRVPSPVRVAEANSSARRALMFGLPVWCSAFLSSHPFGELFFNRGSRSGPFASKRIGSFSALVCIDVATVPKAALTAAVEASFAATPAVAAASATLPASTLPPRRFPGPLLWCLCFSFPILPSRGQRRRGRYTDFSVCKSALIRRRETLASADGPRSCAWRPVDHGADATEFLC
jgi:hypothetical protein